MRSKWRPRATRHFGDVLSPFIEIEIATTRGEYQPIAKLVDSGTVITLLRRSAAALPGLSLESGRPVKVGGTGGARVTAYVHEVNIRFGPSEFPFRAPIAIANSESVPNLLGRHGIFSQLRITLDGADQATDIRVIGPAH
jgi:hypothetical protein